MNTEQIKQAVNKLAIPEVKSKGKLLENQDSWFIQTPTHIFKIRKPIQTEQLDLTHMQDRKAICERELQLNQALATKIYDTVVPLTAAEVSDNGTGAQSDIVDYALKYKRLKPEASLLYTLRRKDEPDKNMLEKIATLLAGFHKDSEIIKNAFNVTKFQQAYEESMRTEYFVLDLLGYAHYSILLRSNDIVKKFLSDNRYYLQERTITGYIRDGHGNLSAENVFPTRSQPAIIGREVEQTFRHNDVLFDIARLGIDLDFFGHNDADQHFLAAYIKAFGEDKPKKANALYIFYKLFRTTDIIAQLIDNATVYTLDASLKNRLSRYFALVTMYLKELK